MHSHQVEPNLRPATGRAVVSVCAFCQAPSVSVFGKALSIRIQCEGSDQLVLLEARLGLKQTVFSSHEAPDRILTVT